jgi:hypothetical protein
MDPEDVRGFGRYQAATDPGEQGRVQTLFQGPYLLRHRRLGQVQRSRGGRERPLVEDRGEAAQLVQGEQRKSLRLSKET